MASVKGMTTAAVLVGGLSLGAAGAALGGQAHTASAASQPAAATAARVHPGARARLRHRRLVARRLLRHRLGEVMTVKSVSGSTIDAMHGAQALTVTVGSSTSYREAGQAAQLSAVQPGERIAVVGARGANNAIQARIVRILLPHEAGVVTGVSGSTLTLTGLNGATHTVNIGSASFRRAGQPEQASDVTAGTAIVAYGTLNSDGSLNAQFVVTRLPIVAGRITAVSGSSYTITNARGVTHTVMVGSGTAYQERGGATASASSLTVGTRIVAQGTLSPDGKTLTAMRIVVRMGSAQPQAGA